MPQPPDKEEILAILKANRDLGPAYEQESVQQLYDLFQQDPHSPASATKPEKPDSLAALINSPGWQRLSRHERRRLLRHAGIREHGGVMGRIMPVLGISIPLIAVAGGIAGAHGVYAVVGMDMLIVLAVLVKQ
ncbi:MAG: hypothetical protein M0Z53_08450 [Thermaerobacter sp.]|nr:hypothetical protein [Thermaerobacter sp.]